MMADLISRAVAIELIENRQRKLCPVGMFSRNAVYGSDREKFDCWQEIIDEIERLPAVDAVPVVHGQWIKTKIPANTTGYGGVGQDKKDGLLCSECRCAFDVKFLWSNNFCPNCGAKMDGERRESE